MELTRPMLLPGNWMGGRVLPPGTEESRVQSTETFREVKNSMEQISKIVEASTIGTQQSAIACQDLSRLTHSLRNLVERFRLARDRDSGGHQDRSAFAPQLASVRELGANPSGSRQNTQALDERDSIHGSGWVQ